MQDAKLAAATQVDLFSTGSAAAYEQYQHVANAARLANEAKVFELKKGMLTKGDNDAADLPIIRNTDVVEMPPIKAASIPKKSTTSYTESRLGSRKPPSIPRATSQVLQRISAASQDYDVPDIPMTPDRGIQLDTRPVIKEQAPVIKEEAPVAQERRPGWRQGNTYEADDGNWWSADFDDEHWNTPSGINEAMGLWGRPVGNRYSGRYQATRNPFVNKKWDSKTNQRNIPLDQDTGAFGGFFKKARAGTKIKQTRVLFSKHWWDSPERNRNTQEGIDLYNYSIINVKSYY